MKEKYIFLIGLGVGIVLTSFVAFFVYNLNLSQNIDSVQNTNSIK